MLTNVFGRVVTPEEKPGTGEISYTLSTPSVQGGALRHGGTVRAPIVDGIIEPRELSEGNYSVWVTITQPSGRSWGFRLPVDGSGIPIDLAEEAPAGEILGGQLAKGEPGDSAYALAVTKGYVGTLEEWLDSLNGIDGVGSYELAVMHGFVGSEQEWLESLATEATAQAAEFATEAAASASTASGSAEAATSAAGSANDSADEAALLATAASASASGASASASNASNSATQSGVSATSASNARVGAETARDESVAARDISVEASATAKTITGEAVEQAILPGGAANRALSANFAGLGALGPTAKVPTARAPYQYLIDLGRPDHGATAAGAVSSNLAYTDSFFRGVQSGRITTSGTRTIAGIRRQDFLPIDMSKKCIEVSIQVDNWDNVGSIFVMLGSNATIGGNYHQIRLYSKHDRATGHVVPSDPGEWLTLTADMTSSNYTSGVPDLTQIRSVQISVQDKGAGPVNFGVNHVSVFDKSPVFPNGVVSITFDDSYLSHFTVGQPELAKYGMQGTFYTIANLLGKDANGQRYYMNLDELKMLQDGGHEIAAHAYTHQAHNAVGGYTSLSPEALDEELRNLKNWLVVNGFGGANHLALPQGIRNVEVDAAVKRYFSSQRGTVRRPHDTLHPGPVRNLHAGNMHVTRAEREAMIDKAYNNGTWLNFTMHDIAETIPSPPGTTIPQRTTADWKHLVEYIANKGMQVRTVGDVLASL